jgi:hypothetical protein
MLLVVGCISVERYIFEIFSKYLYISLVVVRESPWGKEQQSIPTW